MMRARRRLQQQKYVNFRIYNVKLGASVSALLKALAHIIESELPNNEVSSWRKAHISAALQGRKECEGHVFVQVVGGIHKRLHEHVKDLSFVVFYTCHRVGKRIA